MGNQGPLTKYVFNLKDLSRYAPELFGVPTGTRLDELFYRVEYDEKADKYIKKPLGGLPSYSVMNITGVADTGKSLLAEQFALTQASMGNSVIFVTVETPAAFLYQALKERSKILRLDFDKIEENITVIDASQSFELRENVRVFLDTMQFVIENKKAKITIIDSVTDFYEHKEMMARQIVREIYNFLKRWKQTAMLISQKRSGQGAETAEAAGGLAVPHIVDGSIVMSKRVIEKKYEASMYNIPIGQVLRTIRIDGCRLTPHSSETYVFDIDDKGIIEIKGSLKEIVGGE